MINFFAIIFSQFFRTKHIYYRNTFFTILWRFMKIAFFVSISENQQIYEGAISLFYQPILINLDNKLIVLMRGIQWNKLQSNILINKNFRFLPLLCELCSKKSEKKEKLAERIEKKIAIRFFSDFFPYKFKW